MAEGGWPLLPEPLRLPRPLIWQLSLSRNVLRGIVRDLSVTWGASQRSMARSDLLINLVKAGASGDQVLFRRTVDALVAEERGKNHGVLADRLTQAASVGGKNGHHTQAISLFGTSPVNDLFFELNPRRSFTELILPPEVVTAIQELVEEQHRHELLRTYNIQPRNRILLAGEPGNGKTSLAEGVAHALAVPLIVARYDGLIGCYLGETANRLAKLFDFVRSRPCVLFFDEFDTVGKERGDEHETGEIKRVVSSLLLQIDALPPHVVVVTATNHPELLDRAVWRRFQLRLELPRPSPAEAEAFFDAAVSRLGFSLDTSSKTLADKLRGASFSELEDFLADVSRRYVLSLPDANVRKIVQHKLSQWQQRFRPQSES